MKLLDAVKAVPITVAGWLSRRQPNAWAIIFDRRQNVEGNAFALARYLATLPDTEIYLIDHRLQPKPIPLDPGSKIRVVRGGSWQEIRARLRCRQVVVSDRLKPVWGPFRWLAGVRLVNVWHGIPVKAMGNMAEGFPRAELAAEFHDWSHLHTFCVSSELERSFMTACFLTDASKVRVTGIPRTDMLLQPSRMTARQQQIDAEVAAAKNGRKMILYAPTFRDYQVGASGLQRADMERLNVLLARHDVLLAVRPHPREADTYDQLTTGLSHVLPADSRRWEDGNGVLRQADALITDYSSLWLEFLLLQRPMLAFWWDYEKYASDRGFLVDIETLFPGPRAATAAALQTELESLLAAGFAIDARYQLMYDNVRKLFHRHIDGRSCERIVAAVMAD